MMEMGLAQAHRRRCRRKKLTMNEALARSPRAHGGDKDNVELMHYSWVDEVATPVERMVARDK